MSNGRTVATGIVGLIENQRRVILRKSGVVAHVVCRLERAWRAPYIHGYVGLFCVDRFLGERRAVEGSEASPSENIGTMSLIVLVCRLALARCAQ